MGQGRKRRQEAREAYEAYILSDEWRLVRQQYRRERPWACAVCGTSKRLHLHHRTYERLGSEQLDDLVPLCKKHHKQTHLLVGAGTPLWEAHSQIDHKSSVVRLPPAGRPVRQKPRPRKKIKPRDHSFKKNKEPVQCEKCRTLYQPNHPKLRCECGGLIVLVRG